MLFTFQLYPTEDLLQAKYELLSQTKMIDYSNQVYRQIHNLTEDDENEPGENALSVN